MDDHGKAALMLADALIVDIKKEVIKKSNQDNVKIMIDVVKKMEDAGVIPADTLEKKLYS